MQTKAKHYDFLAQSDGIPRGNVTTEVTDALRQAIVTLAMKPGEVIDKSAISARMGVSRFPISEALARLQAEGLVDIQPQRGTSVSLIRIADVSEYSLIRKAIEAEAVQALVAARIPDIVTKLQECLARQSAAAEADDRETFHQLDCEFHELLFAAMQFSKVKTIIDTIRANVDRARRLITKPRRLGPTIEEHEAIVKAIAAGDGDAAAQQMRAHIDAVMAEIVAFAQQEPQHFADGETLSDPT